MAGNKQAEPCGESDVYREEILDHSRNPRNKRALQDPTFMSRKANMSCGDTVSMSVRLDDDGRITEIGFEGVGCAISMAAVSMLTEALVGKDLDEVMELGIEYIGELFGTEIGPARVRCASLGLDTLKRGIEEYRQNS
jgi:nitrogen fixation NifU-like protein